MCPSDLSQDCGKISALQIPLRRPSKFCERGREGRGDPNSGRIEFDISRSLSSGFLSRTNRDSRQDRWRHVLEWTPKVRELASRSGLKAVTLL